MAPRPVWKILKRSLLVRLMRIFQMFASLLTTSAMIIEVQGVVNPITTKLYQRAGGDPGSADSGSADQEPMMDHDEL